MVKLGAFKRILRKTQEELKQTLENFVNHKGYISFSGDGFLYAKGTIPILLVAHMDTVHKNLPENIFYDDEQKIMWSPEGIGGDDRCGVYAIMKIIENGYRPHVLFLEDEEIGCIGAEKCTDILKKPDVKFIIEIDRRGKQDCVFYDCGNDDFIKYIETFGFKEAMGTFSDICTLSKAWDIASVNLSSGYYNEHTTHEYINLFELMDTTNKVMKILDNDEVNEKFYDYQEVTYTYGLPNTTGNTKIKSKDITYADDYGYVDETGRWHWYDF